MNNNITQYNGLYKDNFGTENIIVYNDYDMLWVEINGMKFEGDEFSDLAIVEKSTYSEEQLQRFTFIQVPIYQTDIIRETLCNCSFEIIIPQIIIDKQANSTFLSDLRVEYERPIPRMGIDFDVVKISFVIKEIMYSGQSSDFESAFDQIRDQFSENYQFKNCYGCMYGDYGVAGNSSFGMMLCFVNQKEQYKAVTNKNEYIGLTEDIERVQEIYLCDKFEIRKKGAGYRG